MLPRAPLPSKLCLCLIKRHGGIASPFLTSALDGQEWQASRTGQVNLEEAAPGTHWLGVWVASGLFWTLWSREKYFVPAENRLRTSSPSLYQLSYTGSRASTSGRNLWLPRLVLTNLMILLKLYMGVMYISKTMAA
jgi:hypothetical protein